MIRAAPGWGIVHEFLRVVTHPKVMKDPWPVGQARGFVEALLASPGFQLLAVTDRHDDVFSEVVAEVPLLAGSLFHAPTRQS